MRLHPHKRRRNPRRAQTRDPHTLRGSQQRQSPAPPGVQFPSETASAAPGKALMAFAANHERGWRTITSIRADAGEAPIPKMCACSAALTIRGRPSCVTAADISPTPSPAPENAASGHPIQRRLRPPEGIRHTARSHSRVQRGVPTQEMCSATLRPGRSGPCVAPRTTMAARAQRRWERNSEPPAAGRRATRPPRPACLSSSAKQ